MKINPEFILNIGIVLSGFIWTIGFLKILRNNKRLKILMIFSVGLLIFSFWLLNNDIKLENGISVSYIYISPIIYVLTFSILRRRFLKKYNFEPTYNWISWYDKEDERNQNWDDVFVHIVPFGLSFIIPIILSLNLK